MSTDYVGFVSQPEQLQLGSVRIQGVGALPDGTPGVCSPWDKPEPVNLDRLSGLDLEGCAVLIRTPGTGPISCAPSTIDAFLRARIICVGTNTTFTDTGDLLAAGLIVIDGIDLAPLPRAGFCITLLDDELHATVRRFPWIP